MVRRSIVIFVSLGMFVVGLYAVFTMQPRQNPLAQFKHDMVVADTSMPWGKLRVDAQIKIAKQYWGTVSPAHMLTLANTYLNSCHGLAHYIGERLVREETFMRTMEICQLQCLSGCMHGALIELASGSPETVKNLRAQDNQPAWLKEMVAGSQRDVSLETFLRHSATVCYGLFGDKDMGWLRNCVHGMGHMYTKSQGRNIQKALSYCNTVYEKPYDQYTCSEGSYMELIINEEFVDEHPEDLLSPCTKDMQYPGGCYKEKMIWLLRNRPDVSDQTLLRTCEAFEDRYYRLACMYAYGARHSEHIRRDMSTMATVCVFDGDEQRMCIDGGLEHLSSAGGPACAGLQNERAYCESVVQNGLFSRAHDFSRYVKTQ